MKKPTNTKRLQLGTQVVRQLDNENLAKVGGASGVKTCYAALCSACCWTIGFFP